MLHRHIASFPHALGECVTIAQKATNPLKSVQLALYFPPFVKGGRGDLNSPIERKPLKSLSCVLTKDRTPN